MTTKSVQHKIYNQLAPTVEEGPRCLVKQYVLAANVFQGDNLTMEVMEQQMSFVQTLWFDTTLMTAMVQFVSERTEQTLELPKLSQGYIPILAGPELHFRVLSTGTGTLNLIFINVPMPAIIWVPGT